MKNRKKWPDSDEREKSKAVKFVKHKTLCGCDSVIQQLIDLDSTQNQAVSQENDNVQLAAIAVALSGGQAKQAKNPAN